MTGIREPRATFALLAVLAAACGDSSGPPRDAPDRVAYTCTTSEADICTMAPDGTDRRVVVADDLREDEMPAWSPDGSRIAFISNPSTFDSPVLAIVDADGANASFFQETLHASWPTWSPDGSRIAFSGFDGLYVMNVDGTGRTRITGDLGIDRTVWSPDGTRIAFGTLRRFGGGAGIWVVSPAGTGLTQVTTGARDGFPTWSPDGQRLAFSVGGDGIYVVGADGSNRQRILANSTAIAPAWSPGGDRIIFTASAAPTQLWSMAPDGTDARALQPASIVTGDRDAAWRPRLRE